MAVKPEKYGARDMGLSLRHRYWGVGCPAVDIDLLLAEYNFGKPAALVEYKHERAKDIHLGHPSYQTIANLATNSHIPAFVAQYSEQFINWNIFPINRHAEMLIGETIRIDEQGWVEILYQLRKKPFPKNMFDENRRLIVNDLLP